MNLFWNSKEEMLPFVLKLWLSHKFQSIPIQLHQMWNILILHNSSRLRDDSEAPVLWGQSALRQGREQRDPCGLEGREAWEDSAKQRKI